MNLISVENISKSYTEKQILNQINLGISESDKLGLIGINGTGKSTLIKIIAGVEEVDEGRIIKGNAVKIEYLSQNPDFDPEAVVLEQIFKGNSTVMKIIQAYERALKDPASSDEKILKLSHDMDIANAWGIESEAKSILSKLGITDHHAKVGTLSGGQRKRIALAAALIHPSDVLILDEPTNHLDNEAIDWLERYLNNRKGALIMITHDRYFLDRVVNQIIELDQGSLYAYKGNYSSFLEKKAERMESEAASGKKRQSLFKKELAWIRKGAKARTTKQKARIDRFEVLSESNVDNNKEKMDISVASSRLGRKIVEIENISKAFGDNQIICDFTYLVLRDDRVGIIGPNGSGKSTLINIISGKLLPDTGTVQVGETVRMGVFSQETYHMDDRMRVMEYIKEGAEYVTTATGDKISASQMLERFLFPDDLQWTPIGKLSGGEKRRLHLLRILIEAPNVLILDEPTNDIDIETLTILEEYLEEFPGAVIAISHDRYFLDKMAEKIFVFEGKGKIVQYTGNYTQLRESHDKKQNEDQVKQNESKDQAVKEKRENRKEKDKPLKFSFKEQKEYEEIDGIVAEIENKIQETEVEISNVSANYVALQELMAKKEQLEKQLEEKMERWVYLNELAEKLAEQSSI